MEDSFKMIKKTEQIFLILGNILISITTFLMPLNYVPNEDTHAKYAWTIFHAKQPDSIKWRYQYLHELKFIIMALFYFFLKE